MTTTLQLPIFPLGTVLYPDGRLPLRIFEPRYVDMTKACLRDEAPFGVALIRAGFEVGRPAIPCAIGCTARIAEWQVPSPGLFTIVAQGVSPFRVVDRRTQPDGLIVADVELLAASAPTPLPKAQAPLGSLLLKLIEDLGAERFPQPQRLDDADWVGYRLAEVLPIAPERKQTLLELQDPLQRLAAIERALQELRDA